MEVILVELADFANVSQSKKGADVRRRFVSGSLFSFCLARWNVMYKVK